MDPTPTPPAPEASLVLDAGGIERALKRVAHEIIEKNVDLTKVAIVGIPSRGVEVARYLAEYVEQFTGVRVETGVVDVSMHRDDFHRRRRLLSVQPTVLPADLSDKTLVLTDDVLFSGRSCRAAMDAISSFGRPAKIRLAVLIDRGHRELPIRPDYVGKNLPTAYSQRVFVRFQTTDGVPNSVWVDKA